jgi:phosphoserine phosphatase RsbU/P
MQGNAEEIFITLRNKDGTSLPVLVNAERIDHNNKEVYQYVGIIVSNRNKFEEELIEARKVAQKALSENVDLLQAKLEMQQYVEALDKQIKIIAKQNDELKQFSRVVSHNLQEPLRKLSVFTELFLQAPNTIEQYKYLEKLRNASAQMREVVSGLQKYVWLSDAPLNFTKIEINRTLANIISQLNNEFPGIQLTIEMPESYIIEGDIEQIHLLFYELLSNSLRFRKQKESASVSITIENIQKNIFQSVKNKYKYVDFLQINIRDRGTGFNPDFKDQTFELFKTLHAESGKGIGLSLCSKVVNNHNGSIKIDSKPGEWTLITIYLPWNHVNIAETETAVQA